MVTGALNGRSVDWTARLSAVSDDAEGADVYEAVLADRVRDVIVIATVLIDNELVAESSVPSGLIFRRAGLEYSPGHVFVLYVDV
jgi:hypothetical protein